MRLYDVPAPLPTDDDGRTALRRWRELTGRDVHHVAAAIGVSWATWYRLEVQGTNSLRRANALIEITRGAVSYPDILRGFKQEYAKP